tara:strand:+ start:614 stop:757 length:144 start_codon:yes stop_codon:yes gene_type:complete
MSLLALSAIAPERDEATFRSAWQQISHVNEMKKPIIKPVRRKQELTG